MPLDPLDAETVIRLLDLEPLPPEGGYFRSTYRAPVVGLERPLSTAIYYLVTPEQFSALHRLPHDELFHFYRGDEVEQFLIHPDGRGETRRLGPAIERGTQPQVVVPGGAWQGTRLVAAGR